ncbi:MAG: hypothetical protein UZ07_CHB004002234 [Chlorobi bacterium OLB7]|nr:MAG: hypothetical protein UZ07_CHB004002234 [Chlorobi bacterium OLB7]
MVCEALLCSSESTTENRPLVQVGLQVRKFFPAYELGEEGEEGAA